MYEKHLLQYSLSFIFKDIKVEPPIPNIRLKAAPKLIIGYPRFNAASPSAPTPLPTNTPSTIAYKAVTIIPVTAGIEKFKNNLPTESFPKLILLDIFCSFN